MENICTLLLSQYKSLSIILVESVRLYLHDQAGKTCIHTILVAYFTQSMNWCDKLGWTSLSGRKQFEGDSFMEENGEKLGSKLLSIRWGSICDDRNVPSTRGKKQNFIYFKKCFEVQGSTKEV